MTEAIKAKIVLEINDTKHELTIEKAQELRELLIQLLGTEKIMYLPIFQPSPLVPPYTIGDHWVVTSGDNTNGYTITSNSCQG